MSTQDEYHDALIRNVRPKDWVNPKPNGRYNLVVIGAGTAGLVAAAGAAKLGANVALIERDFMGGDCLNAGCVPSKAIIRSARAAAAVRDAEKFGVETRDEVQINFAAVMRRMREIRVQISKHDSAERFRDLGVDVFLGEGVFAGPDSIMVGEQTLQFKRALIATGARAFVPPIPGLKDVDYLTNENLFRLTELPRRLAILGAGPIGSEMAQTFARLGSKVFLVETAKTILPREDPDASSILADVLSQDGVALFCDVENTNILKNGDEIQLEFLSNEETHNLVVDQLLISVGRSPNVESLNLAAANVDYAERSGVVVNDRLQTTNSRIYVAGDVCSKFKFTHAADFMARVVLRNALFLGRGKASALTIPWCTYTSPEIAHVGISPHNSDASKVIELDTFVQPFKDVDRAILDGETNGFVKVHVAKGTDKILGATIVASNAGDLISEITLAMNNGVGLKKIGNTIHPYPTQADAIRKLGDQFNSTRLTPRVKWLLKKWFGWNR